MTDSDTPTDTPSAPPRLCAYAADVIAERLDKMLSHVEGVKESVETEPVHQMRVWSRRSRAALDIFHLCFPGKAFAEIEREVKSVTGALGQARDLDVMIETLSKRAEALPPAQRGGVDSFVDHLRQERKTAQRAVEKAVTRLEKRDLVLRFRKLTEETDDNFHARGKVARAMAQVRRLTAEAPEAQGSSEATDTDG
jgi:CHAD domain-containing protein